MKIFMPIMDRTKIGGGWSFADNFVKAFQDELTSYEQAEVLFIPGATMVDPGYARQAKKDGKKVVLRVDNHLLPSRNRNSGMRKLHEMSNIADVVIFQSKWAKDYLGNLLGIKGQVILNGVDLETFYPAQVTANTFLYVRSSRINEKGWEMARYLFSRYYMEFPESRLTIIGKFSRENIEYNFDFINNENYVFYGQVSNRELAVFMRNHKYFLYSYFMDACSNTLIEALCSGCQVIDVYGMLQTGGAAEIMQAWAEYGREYFSLDRMMQEYSEVLA